MALRAFAAGALFGEAGGSGPPRVLALHGWARRHADFAGVLQGLDYLALDLPGFGASPPPAGAMGAREYAELVEPVLSEMGPNPVIVGHSFGGRVGLVLASRHRQVRGLVLAGVPLLAKARKPPPLRYRLGRLAHRYRLLSDPALERLRQRYGSSDYRAASGVMRQVLVRVVNESYEAELQNLEVPVHLIWGEDDREVPLEVASRALDLLHRHGGTAVLEVVPGAGHLLPLEAPEALRRAIMLTLELV
ncbi:MAG TPA: alpha/beta hydrolase [Acidimicrobiia bacterium]|nr:alpha/beta hydrolase [Acidimicrobiia bacterium]